jgi:hypothetical protein
MAGLLLDGAKLTYCMEPRLPLKRNSMKILYILVALLTSWTVGILALYGAFRLYEKYFT